MARNSLLCMVDTDCRQCDRRSMAANEPGTGASVGRVGGAGCGRRTGKTHDAVQTGGYASGGSADGDRAKVRRAAKYPRHSARIGPLGGGGKTAAIPSPAKHEGASEGVGHAERERI